MKKTFAAILALSIIAMCTQVAFAKTAYMIGDTDKDGNISITDATAIQLHCAGLRAFDNVTKKLADVDGDDNASVMDATYIQKFLAQHIDRFPGDKENTDSPSLDDDGYNNEIVKP